MIDKERAKAILEILKKEYGITTEEELDEAIRKQKPVDITPFCVRPRSVLQPLSQVYFCLGFLPDFPTER